MVGLVGVKIIKIKYPDIIQRLFLQTKEIRFGKMVFFGLICVNNLVILWADI